MFHTTKPVAARLYTFVNAAIVLLVLLGVLIGLNWRRMPGGFGEFLAIRVPLRNLFLSILILLSWAIAFRAFGLSKPSRRGVTKAFAVASDFVLLFALATQFSGAFTGRIFWYFLPAAILACYCGRFVAGRLARFSSGSQSLIIVGSGPRALAKYKQLQEPSYGSTRVLGFVDSKKGHLVSETVRGKMLGGLDDLEEILMKQPVDEVVIALPAKTCYEEIQTAMQTCECAGVEAQYDLSDIFNMSLASPHLEANQPTPMVRLKIVRGDYRLLVKRCIDIAGAVLGLATFGPLMLATAVAIKLTSPGSALFTQERFGLRKRRFRMYKFRTMVQNADHLQTSLEDQNEKVGPIFKMKHDPRITPLGRLLRVSSIDELPQLLNVIRGHMSLVGPRPMSVRDVLRFKEPSLMRRFSVRPGLTCIWQVNGRSNTTFSKWMELDLKYIDSWSLGLDLSILVRTVPAVIRGQGAA